jgi:hypothetical protein
MEPGGKVRSRRQTVVVRQFLGQGERFVIPIPGLVRIAEQLQGQATLLALRPKRLDGKAARMVLTEIT